MTNEITQLGKKETHVMNQSIDLLTNSNTDDDVWKQIEVEKVRRKGAKIQNNKKIKNGMRRERAICSFYLVRQNELPTSEHSATQICG